MSISDRLDEIESRPVAWPWLDRAADDKRVLVAAVRAVLDVCEGLEEAHRANPTQMYEYGMEEAAHQVRNAIAAALGEGQ